MTKLSDTNIFEHWPAHWPSRERFVSQHDVSMEQQVEFEKLVSEKASETTIEKYFADHPEVLAITLFLFSTGHHAAWIYPKQQIRPVSGEVGGLIPDYVLAGANSEGVVWWVLELKGANHKAFVKRGKRVYLSQESNKGICQLLNYIDMASRSQSYLRDEIGLNGFREPKGLLLIGNDEESEDTQVMDFKNAWNRINPRIQIKSYNSLLRALASKIEHKL